MTANPSTQPSTIPKTAKIEAVVVGRRFVDFQLTQLIAALKKLEPAVSVGDWGGPFKAPPTDDLGIKVLSVDGVKLSIFNMSQGLPSQVFDCGPIKNYMIPDAPEKLRNNRAHAIIMPIAEYKTLAGAVETARIVTLVARAVASLMQADAVHWLDGNNVVPMAPFNSFTQHLEKPEALPVEVWVRFMCGAVTDTTTRRKGLVAATYGLWAFGLPEIDYQPSDLPFELLLSHAYGLSRYLLSSGKVIAVGDTMNIDEKRMFKVDAIEKSRLSGFEALQLVLV